MKDLKVLSTSIHPRVGRDSIHNVDSISTALLGIDVYTKYRVDHLYISPNCHYILSSISESHGSPKTNFTALKEKVPKNIQQKMDANQNICF